MDTSETISFQSFCSGKNPKLSRSGHGTSANARLVRSGKSPKGDWKETGVACASSTQKGRRQDGKRTGTSHQDNAAAGTSPLLPQDRDMLSGWRGEETGEPGKLS